MADMNTMGLYARGTVWDHIFSQLYWETSGNKHMYMPKQDQTISLINMFHKDYARILITQIVVI